jgi:Tfp pilus assembly protein PilV
MKGSRANSPEGQSLPLRPDAGVGVTEALIALVIFSTALLGIVGTSARVGASVNASHVRLRALAVARYQVEQLLSTEYDKIAAGSAQADVVQMAWNVTTSSSGKEIVLVYQYSLPGGARSDTLTTAVLRQ